MSISINCPWLEESLPCWEGCKVQISIVAYAHPAGIPARFCAGLIPAIDLTRRFAEHGVKSTVRLIDPSPIANYCNGWENSEPRFRGVLGDYLAKHGVSYFFDIAEPVTDETLAILNSVGQELETPSDPTIADMVQRIKESGRKHGGSIGEDNAIVYMAAHPFSWLDLHHPLVWNRRYDSDSVCYINLMSKPESRFTAVRRFLTSRRPDLSSGINPVDRYMTICNTPCYIPLEGEPTFGDLTDHGPEWCLNRYLEIKKVSNNHRRAYKDFESLMSFQG